MSASSSFRFYISYSLSIVFHKKICYSTKKIEEKAETIVRRPTVFAAAPSLPPLFGRSESAAHKLDGCCPAYVLLYCGKEALHAY